ncbi:mPR-like GPCR protein [Fusarium oxysporum]|nr:mPR-like GPCR protein [Fusarium oxysporum]
MANLSPITRNVTRHDISEWRQDNKYIFAGYCPLEADYLQVIKSLTFLHNKTCNIYTYLIGAILLPLFATTILQTIYRPQHINIIRTDFIIFTIFFYFGESCLIFSAVCYLIRSHSYEVIFCRSAIAALISIPKIGAYVMLGVSAFIPFLYGIFYISILCAIYVHMIALTQAFTACYTLDICHI